MSNQESKFLEIVDLKKGFGSGETRHQIKLLDLQDLLNGF